MSGILRGVPVVDEKVVIGDAPRHRRFARLPPPPPSSDSGDWARGDDGWEESFGGLASPAIRAATAHDVAERLADAERLLEDARDESERIPMEARRTAGELLESSGRQADELVEVARADLARVRAEAAELLQETVREAERLRVEARQTGHAEGVAEGRVEGNARIDEELAGRLARVTALADSAAVDRRALLRNAEVEVVRLALEIARKILRQELSSDPSVVHRIAEAALEQVAIDGLVKLRVNPADYAELGDYWVRAHGSNEGDRSYEIVADAQVSRGGVVIDTRSGTIDAQVETQLDEISRALGMRADDPMYAE